MRLRLLLPALAAFALSCSDPTEPDPEGTAFVVAGSGFSCALVSQRVWCWGRNEAGQLGRGPVGVDEGPGPVAGDHRFRLLAAGERTACGVTTDNEVLCWGHGRLFGNSGPTSVPTPISGPFPASITSIGVGYSHGCVLSAGGTTSCFGSNSSGELGNGTLQPTGSLGATNVIGGHSFSQLSVGAFHTCGLQGVDVWCWGTNHAFVFGPGSISAAPYANPTKMTLSFGAARVYLGSAVTCVLDAAAKAWCWGSNVAAQLGRGAGTASTASPDPTLVIGDITWRSLAMPNVNSTITHTCGVPASGNVTCWGLGDASQLGSVATESCAVTATSAFACSGVPTTTESALQFKQLALGRDHTCGVTAENEIYCWGSDAHLQLGGTVGAPTKLPVRITIAIAAER